MAAVLKANCEDLAILGGTPAFSETIHVGRPNIGDRASLLRRINRILDQRWLTNNGPFVQAFEQRVAKLLGVRHCVAMCNATVALEISIRALGLTGEVIVPSFTFIATAHAVHWQGITPVFCDVDPDTHNLDPGMVEGLITPKTSGIIGVHVWGRPCAVDALTAIAKRSNLKLMFDAAHAFSNSFNGRMIGNFGEAEVFSFHATKIVNTFEGGAVMTNDDELAAKLRLMRNFGFEGYDHVTHMGTNGKMSEASAAMGLSGLDSLDEFIKANYRNYTIYRRALAGISGIRLLAYDETERRNFHYIVVEVDESKTGISRDDLVRILHAENVLARRYFYPGCHEMEPYRSEYPQAGLRLTETKRLAAKVMTLPTGSAVGPEEIEVICAIIALSAAHGPALGQKMAALGEDGIL
jgi:dTDP-4-amino-4,6-dideoxygalactose transaminase